MALLTRDAIFVKNDLETRTVDVPEWGGQVIVRGLTGTERDMLEQSVVNVTAKGGQRMNLTNLRAKLVAMACVNEDGTRMFRDEDVAMLGTKSGAALDRIYDVAAALSGIGDRDVEELLGNSGSGPNEGSTSV